MSKVEIPLDELALHVKERRTLQETATKLGCCAVTVFAALKRAGLHSNGRKFTAKKDPRCCRCGCTDPAKFKKRYGKAYQSNPNGIWCAWCMDCYHDVAREFKRQNREKIIAYLGGKCIFCGFSKYHSALDSHHVDPAAKDISASNMVGWKWERIEKELAGCVLLCSNCHRGFHNNELSDGDKAVMERLGREPHVTAGVPSPMPP